MVEEPCVVWDEDQSVKVLQMRWGRVRDLASTIGSSESSLLPNTHIPPTSNMKS